MVSNALILLTMALLSIGISQRFKQRPRYILLSAIMVLTLSGLGFYIFAHDGLLERSAILGLGLAAICLTILADIPKRQQRTPVEALLFWLVVASALAFVCRPLFAVPSIVGEDFKTAYWLAISISDTLICSTLAVGIFAIIAVDITKKIRSEAESDFLSGLLNRRGLKRNAEMLLHAQPDLDTFSLIVSDLDLFKSINDHCGHAAGDRIIQCFARILRLNSPPEAIIARLGGEEFAILLPSCDLSTAHKIAEDIRITFETSAPGIVRDALQPTASFGIAIATGHEDLEALLDQADQALYRAKKEGRNCVRSLKPHFDDKWSLAG